MDDLATTQALVATRTMATSQALVTTEADMSTLPATNDIAFQALSKLPPKHQIFILTYLGNGRNATLAYISVGYSKNGATQSASKLLTSTNVQHVIQLFDSVTLEACSISRERNAQALANTAYAEPSGDPRHGDVIKAVQALNKMEGYDAVTQVDVHHKFDEFRIQFAERNERDRLLKASKQIIDIPHEEIEPEERPAMGFSTNSSENSTQTSIAKPVNNVIMKNGQWQETDLLPAVDRVKKHQTF